jgi:hypothetical protein
MNDGNNELIGKCCDSGWLCFVWALVLCFGSSYILFVVHFIPSFLQCRSGFLLECLSASNFCFEKKQESETARLREPHDANEVRIVHATMLISSSMSFGF